MRHHDSFSWWDSLTYFRVAKPSWIKEYPTDKIMVLFQNMRTLFRDGIVVWGQVIQANSHIFEDGIYNVVGELVYSLDESIRTKPEYLQEVASALGELKGTLPDNPELKPIADYLTDERIRVFGLRVPTTISPAAQCRISSTYFVRHHLPTRRLSNTLMPIVVNPREPFVAMPLPGRYWPKSLVEWWSGIANS